MTLLILISSFIILLILSVPIGFSLALASVLAIILSPEVTVSFSIVIQRLFSGLSQTSIMAIPFFVLAGNIMTQGGISKSLVELANAVVGKIRGGIAQTLVISSALFASLSGSGPATVLAIGSTLYKDMVADGYPPKRVAGLLSVAGGLGPIIPPSIIMVVIGTLTGASIGDLFISGIAIGILMVLILMVTVFIYAKKENWPKAKVTVPIKNFPKVFIKAIPALMLPIIILGGIYLGIMTPTESSAMAVVWGVIASVFIYKKIKLRDLVPIIIESGKSTAMILFIVAASTLFSWIISYTGVSQQLVNFISGMDLSATMFILLTAIIFLLFGMFIEGIGVAVLLLPLLWPMAQSLGVDVIHFGIVVSISIVLGTMTPPVAINIFSASSLTKLKMGSIIKGQLPFFIAYLIIFALIIFFPFLSTFLIK
ncbi:TRAP transporter large permease [Oceanobacillus jeddahense]|uniref:TRAP transporter large permease n=1 Tax=Oceanobacillus jeddahense TaxID=1462527 RepID=UPI000595C188|nr:TRAP transporter large permease [Oceanobacillus jeddahense]